ncbi:MAG TPA: HNH endonuclease [Kineosporiaceae bacterium]|nr:HNH endonuclease [Kineosporiaceae bacterium]
MDVVDDPVLGRLLALRRHQQDGKRSPHKPLLALLALGQLAATGSSQLRWSAVEQRLGRLIADYGPPSGTAQAQAAAYPFTRLRSDGVWTLSSNVPMDRVRPLTDLDVVGRLDPAIEARLVDPDVLYAVARALVEAEFPPTIASDVLVDVGLDPDQAAGPTAAATAAAVPGQRRRNGGWPGLVLTAWDRQCAFCGFDGQLGYGSVGIEAAHIWWFTYGGPDALDNGLALCALHHKLFDRGALGLTRDHRIKVSGHFTARTPVGRQVYALAGQRLRPRPGTPLPAAEYLVWHDREVFKGSAGSAARPGRRGLPASPAASGEGRAGG